MTGEWVPLDEAATLAGITPKHMRRVHAEAQRGFRTFWKGERLVWRGGGSAVEIAVRSLPLEAREAFLIQHYHLNLALPDPPPRNTVNWNGTHGPEQKT